MSTQQGNTGFNRLTSKDLGLLFTKDVLEGLRGLSGVLVPSPALEAPSLDFTFPPNIANTWEGGQVRVEGNRLIRLDLGHQNGGKGAIILINLAETAEVYEVAQNVADNDQDIFNRELEAVMVWLWGEILERATRYWLGHMANDLMQSETLTIIEQQGRDWIDDRISTEPMLVRGPYILKKAAVERTAEASTVILRVEQGDKADITTNIFELRFQVVDGQIPIVGVDINFFGSRYQGDIPLAGSESGWYRGIIQDPRINFMAHWQRLDVLKDLATWLHRKLSPVE